MHSQHLPSKVCDRACVVSVLCVQNGMPDSPVKPVSNDYSYLTDLYHGEFPKVLIQLPMYNEDAHCDLIIHRCCKIKWPSHRILIQVGQPGVCGCMWTCVAVPVYVAVWVFGCMREGRREGRRLRARCAVEL